MIVKMFQPRFAPAVQSGEKKQTIRPTPKRMPHAGEIISCREWAGKPYRSKQRELFRGIITEVSRIVIFSHEDGMRVKEKLDAYGIQKRWSAIENSNAFAKADGFKSETAMRRWFVDTHGLPFAGILIRWAKIDEARENR